jgi:hypothetical protein
MDQSRQAAAFLLTGACALLLGGCNSLMGSAAPAPAAAAPVVAPAAFSPDALVGRWGLASYQKEADRARTQKEARAQCNKPYVIARGPNGGVMMHLADQKQPQELVLKGGPGGKTFLGPAGVPGGPDDREVSAVDPSSFTVNWVDPENAGRYGTMVYERCGGA